MNIDLQSIQRPGLLGHFFALVCGALIPFSLEPYNFWPLQIVAIALLLFFKITDQQTSHVAGLVVWPWCVCCWR